MVVQTEPRFGALLRRYRLAANLSQEALATRAGLSREAISTLERGTRRAPRPETVHLLADALALDRVQRAALGVASRDHEETDAPSAPAPHLPTEITSLVGRECEIADIAALVGSGSVRLLTLTGAPGVGKTRVALTVAESLRSHFADEVRFVSLAQVRTSGLVAEAIALGLGLWEADDANALEIVQAHLGAKRLLLVLDNFEHLTGAARMVADLLAACPGLAILVTSRRPLRIRGEHEREILPLALPNPHTLPTPEALGRSAAVALFVERVSAVKPDFALTRENATAVAAICRRLDGLPLALELAAVRVKALTPMELLPHLEHRLAILTGGGQDRPERHRSLRAALVWSYDALQPGEQALFCRLATFAAGGTVQAVARVSGIGNAEALDGLAALVDHSLARPHERVGGTRFGMIETVREYGLERLAAAGELAATRRAHAEYYLALVETAHAGFSGPERADELERLTAEHEDILSALGWAMDAGEVDLGLRLAAAVATFWDVRGHRSGGRRWLEALLTLGERGGSDATESSRMRALSAAGKLAERQGDYHAAETLFVEALALQRAHGDREDATALRIGPPAP